MGTILRFLWVTTTLALRGALVKDLRGTVARSAVASIAGCIAGVALLLGGSPLWLAALMAGLTAGAIAPYLLRNIKLA